MLSTMYRELPFLRAVPAVLAAVLLAGCVYRLDVQQGNLLEESAVEQVQVGMTRSQVQFLLGTPMVADAFRRDRWDYPYYFRQGRSRNVAQRWFVVHFEADRVARLERRIDVDGPLPQTDEIDLDDLQERERERDIDIAAPEPGRG
jgi:outer membrane protein assembly factor BamE